MQYLVYILYSSIGDQFYIGHTGELMEERLRKHNASHKGFTGKYHDWQIVYTETYSTKDEAYARERQLKKWKSRKRIEQLIAGSEHPDS